MGNEKKSKEKRKRSSDDEEKSSKKHRDTEEKSRKSDKRKDKKSHKHRFDGEEKKSKDKSKSKHPKHERQLREDIQELSADDYFAKNNEFSTWLREKKGIFFSDLSSESAREMFSDFVKAWNKQKLDSRYYEGIKSAPRTAHNWKFKQPVRG